MAAPEFTAMHLFWSLFLLCSMQYVSIDSIEIKAADSKYIERFEEFMKEHGRLYKSGTAEFKHRYNTFLVSYWLPPPFELSSAVSCPSIDEGIVKCLSYTVI